MEIEYFYGLLGSWFLRALKIYGCDKVVVVVVVKMDLCLQYLSSTSKVATYWKVNFSTEVQ